MSRKIEFTEEQVQNIVAMYQTFVPVREICEKYNVCKQFIYKILKNNVSLHGEKQKFSDSEVLCIIADYDNGESANKIALKMGTTADIIIKILKRNNISIRSRHESQFQYCVNEYYFDEINTYEKAYACGLLWSDGCNKRDRDIISITLQESDKHILEIINKSMNSTYPLHFIDNSKKKCKNTYTLEIKSKHMSERLEELGMTAHKSLSLEFPKWIDKNLYSSFLLGMLDGDGHIAHKKNKYGVVYVCSKNFCEHFSGILGEMNIHYAIYNVGKTGLTKSIHIVRKDDCKKYLDWLYEKCPIYLARKYDVYISKYCSEENINNTSIDIAS